MSDWDAFPADYRAAEVAAIQSATRAGDCVAVAGLSGAGKSNLLGYLAARQPVPAAARYVLVDGNRLQERTVGGFQNLIQRALETGAPRQGESNLEAAIQADLAAG